MDYEKNIEIPFGASDSELHECEYNIPKGYEAKIKEGKVIIRKAESEDEKMKKCIGDVVRKYGVEFATGTITKEKMLAWLEKQGEQKHKIQPKFKIGDIIRFKGNETLKGEAETHKIVSYDNELYVFADGTTDLFCEQDLYELVEQNLADKVESKFKKGQWVVWQNRYYKVNDNGCGYELIDQNGLTTSLEYGTVEESAHLWNIAKDAKDGDVLADGNLPFIFKKIDSEMHSYAYCGISVDDGFIIESDGESGEWTWMQDIKPATKEQRDLLFQKMKEAGYEWDTEKLELKKIEQKPAEISNVCEYSLKTWENIVAYVLKEHNGIGNYLDDTEVRDTAEKLQKKYKFDSASEEWDRVYRRGLDAGEIYGRNKALEEQKSAQSEDDEKMISNVINDYHNRLGAGIITHEYHDKVISWFKSPRPQKQWKPNEYCLSALSDAIIWYKDSGINANGLQELLEQLKKLI